MDAFTAILPSFSILAHRQPGALAVFFYGNAAPITQLSFVFPPNCKYFNRTTRNGFCSRSAVSCECRCQLLLIQFHISRVPVLCTRGFFFPLMSHNTQFKERG